VSLNARIARSENIQHFHAKSKEQNESSVMIPTSLNITANLCGITKQTRKLILQDLKSRRANHTLTHSSALTAEASIKLTQTLVPSGSIASTVIGTTKSNKNFMKIEAT